MSASADRADVPRVDWQRELREQLTFQWERGLWPGIQDLTDEEYLWEPVDGMASLRRREDANPQWRHAGSGDWVVELPPDEHPSPHVTTIAWRLAHITVDVFGERLYHHASGAQAVDRTMVRDHYAWTGTAADGIAQLRDGYERWMAFVAGLGEDGLAQPIGPAEGPFAAKPYAALVQHINREVLHHGAEILLLRDLYRQRDSLHG